MCVSPSTLSPDKEHRSWQIEPIQVNCGWCWQCQNSRLNDLVGRCLLEASTSDWVYAVTLTYRPHNKPLTSAAALNPAQKLPNRKQMEVIHKEDFQNFQKHLRRRFKTRYLVAGEFGSKGTGRTHFHVILFGRGTPPSWELNSNTHIDQWPWGHVYVDSAVSESAIRYTAKYLLKGAKRKKSSARDPKNTADFSSFNKEWISYSRIPIMGIDFVKDLAARYAAESVFPHSFKYRPPFAHENREYQFQGEARHVFFDALLELWPQAEHHKKTESMEKAFLRYQKERQRRRWDALSNAERAKLLDSDLRTVSRPMQRDLRLYGRFLYERLEANGETLSDLKASDPHAYSLARNAFRRDLVAQPPTYAETGCHFPP